MATGKIKRIVPVKGFGFIKPSDGGDDVFFHRSKVTGIAFDDLIDGLEVEFEAVHGEKGLSASSVRPTAAQAGAGSPATTEEQQGEYRFLNPYNFVRFLVPRTKDASTPSETAMGAALREAGKTVKSTQQSVSAQLLGRCPPPPHDRFVGLTGSIACEVDAVTPLFIADAHDVRVEAVGHRTYRFFQCDGRPALPASSLRGVIRSAFETVTSSCMAVFEGGERLAYRNTGIARSMKPAIVETLASDASPGTVVLCSDAKLDPALVNSSRKSGALVWALVKKGRVPVVTDVADSSSALPRRPDTQPVEGWLKITGWNIPNKKAERLFYCEKGLSKATRVEFSIDRERDYNRVLSKQRASNDFETEYQSETLQVDNLVYVELESDAETVRNIAGVKVPRLLYRNAVAVPEHVAPCHDHTKLWLCPACRLFGWVHRRAANLPPSAHVAYAGRVRLTSARLTHSNGTLPETPLAILSSPKPTTVRFYLMPADGQVPEQWNGADVEAGYDGNNVLRGRKFYRHQMRPSEFARKTDAAHDGRDDQNRTVRDALQPGAKFEFRLDFENLASVELGALLWALEMDQQGYHRLGFAKPLGFGSITIRVKDKGVTVIDARRRYTSLRDPGVVMIERARWERWIQEFKDALVEAYMGTGFEQLPNVQDLRAILGEPPNALPVHYPRSSREPNVEGKNFEWFVGNKKRGRGHALRLAPEDREGLPLIDEDGNIVP